MKTSKRITHELFALSFIPNCVFASDPTPLFILFIGIPAVILGLLLLASSFYMKKDGIVWILVLLGAHAPVMNWAYGTGHMDEAGNSLRFSLGVCVAALCVFLARMALRKATLGAHQGNADEPGNEDER